MFRQQQLQRQKQITVYERKAIYDAFYSSIEGLEKYIQATYYLNLKIKKQIRNNKIKSYHSSEVESIFTESLLRFKATMEMVGKPQFLYEEMKQEYYQWLDAAEIDVDNCPSRLKHFLFEFNEVLEGRGEKLKRDTAIHSNSSEYSEQLRIFASMQTPLSKIGEEKQFMERSKSWDFDGNTERGKTIFNLVAREVAPKHDSFQLTNLEKIVWEDVRINPEYWRLDKIPTEVSYLGKSKKQEFVLIHRDARENNFDSEGKLIFSGNPIYRLECFNARQRLEIKLAKNISVGGYLTEEEIKWVVEEVKESPRAWKIRKIDGLIYLIRNSAQMKREEIGTLIHSKQKFSEAEIEEISEAFKRRFSTKNEYYSSTRRDLDFYDRNQNNKNEKGNGVTCKAISCDNNADYWVDCWSDYCSYHEKCLCKLQEYNGSANNIEEIETFETWFNGNCGYLIVKDLSASSEYPYYVWIVVYEPKRGEKGETTKAIKYGAHYGGLGVAIDKVQELKRKLQEDSWESNPILHVYDCANVYKFFSNIVTSPYLIIYHIGTYNYSSNIFYCEAWGSDLSNWDKHVRPLDIVKVEKSYLSVGFDHVGIYLGDNKVCHIYDYLNNSGMKARVDDVSVFLGDTSSTIRSGRVYVYHPIIPFKHYSKIARQVANVEKEEYRKGNYDLANRNCEHLANMLVYGINYSEQVERNEGWFVADNFKGAALGGLFSLLWREYSINNGKSTLKLTNEISESNSKLGYSRADHWRAKEIERNYLQEVPAKETCRIM